VNKIHLSRRTLPLIFVALMSLVIAAGCAGNRPAPKSASPAAASGGGAIAAAPDSVRDIPGFSGSIYRDGRTFIGGQPDQEALRALPVHGVTAVINLRTPKEMADTSRVDFDEAALVDSLDLDYVEIPLGGKDHPYDPAALEAFGSAMEQHTGPVLVHCASGWRASQMWAAYLVRYQGWGVSEAYQRGQEMGIGLTPFSKLLDIRTKVVEDGS